MNTILPAKFMHSGIHSIKKIGYPNISFFTGITILIASFFLSSNSASAASCFNGATVTPSTATVCGSGTTTLTFTGVSSTGGSTNWSANYQWYSSPDGSAWTAIPGATGVVSSSSLTATYTSPTLTAGASCSQVYYQASLTGIVNYCSSAATTFTSTTVTVNICPGAGTITGPVGICIGTATTFSNTTTGGTWSSSNTAKATINSSTGVITSTGSTGAVTISYTVPGGCVATYSTTVATAAPAITGSHYVCLGPGLTNALNAVGGSGTWTSNDVGIATVVGASGVVSGVTLGNTTVTYTVNGGCYSTYTQTVTAIPAAITGPTAPICSSTTLTLSDATSGGTWLSGNVGVALVGSSSGVVTGNSLSVASTLISYSLVSTGCYVTYPVSVNPLPANISGNTSGAFCIGTTITLSNTTGGGTWSSASTSFATVGSSSGIVTGVSAGTTAISYILPTGCLKTTIVTMNPLPTGIVTSGVACVGGTFTASDATSGGSFSSLDPTIASITSSNPATVTGVSGGTVSIRYKIGATQCEVLTTITINALPATPSGSANICLGGTATLTDADAGGTWISGNTSIATIGSLTGYITGVSLGTALISYKFTGTSCVSTKLVTVNAYPTGITGSLNACLGPSVTLSNSTTGGSWTSGNGGVADINPVSGVVFGGAVGTSTITYTPPSGCYVTAVLTVNANPSAITGALSVCPSFCNTLASASTGGTWSSSNAAIASVGASTGVMCGVASGNAFITYTMTSTGCSATAQATVNPAGSAIGGTLSICNGSCTTLTNSTTGGTWTSSNTSVATAGASSGVVCSIAPGTANITYTLPTGCIRTAVVSVNALPAAISGASSVCIGATVTLSNSGGGTWASSNTSTFTVGSSSGVVTGVAATLATVTYTLPTGCYTTMLMTVNSVPGNITGSHTLCAGQTTTLGSITTGGTWLSSNTSIATVGTSGSVSGVSGGTATITYTGTNGCYTTFGMTINATPAAITGSSNVCIGFTTTLADATAGGSWSSGNGSVATVSFSTGVVTGQGVGTAVISYFSTATGCYATDVVSVNSAPATIGGTHITCAGSTATLTDASTGGTWISGNTGIATIDLSTGIFTGVAAGNTSVTYTVSAGCYSITNITVNATPGAITGASAICNGVATTLADASTGGTWTSSNIVVAAINSSGVVVGLSAGTTTISYVLGNGCYTTTTFTVNDLPLATTGVPSFCEGSTSAFSNTTAGGGTWSSSNASVATIAATGVATGIAPGTAIITFTSGTTGCYATTNIEINPLPAVITGPSSVCTGSSATLSDASVGSWISSNAAVATIDVVSGVYTGLSAGTATISFTNGCTVMQIVTVNPLPQPISGSTSGCVGLTTSLTDASGGGTWSISPTTTATIGATSGVVTGVAAGSASIIYTLPTGCKAYSFIEINPSPAAITGNSSVTVGATITLSTTTTGGTWSSSNTTRASVGSAGNVKGLSAGTVTISYTLSTGCYAIKAITVTPANQPPVIRDTTITMHRDTTITVCIPINDADGVAPYAVTNLHCTSNNTCTFAVSGNFVCATYTPNAHFTGIDSVCYRVCDSAGACDSAKIKITVTDCTVPVLAITMTNTLVCTAPVTYNAELTNAGHSNVYQWYKNTSKVGTNAATFIDSSTVLDGLIYCTVIGTVCSTPDTAISNTLTTTSNCIHIPEGFSPNGDGVNDLFVIKSITDYPKNHLELFNRWGNKVYDAAPYTNNWNGKASEGVRLSGDDLPVGTYFYVLDMGNGSKAIKGYVYLSR